MRNLTVTGKRKVAGQNKYINVSPEIIDLKFVFSAIGVNQEQLVDIGILIGTDFNPGVKGYGPKKALKAISGSWN